MKTMLHSAENQLYSDVGEKKKHLVTAMEFRDLIEILCSILVTPLLILLISLNCLAQTGDRNNNWYFNHNAAISWSYPSAIPTILNNCAIDTYEGSASISDYNGNLLFYTNGINVWNSSNQIVGTGLLGGESSSQSSLIVPKPLNPGSFYIFTTPHFGECCLTYSEVFVNGLTVTMGSLNNLIYGQINMSEKITAVCMSNGQGIWVITHEANSDVFIFIKVTSSGPSFDHIQPIGQVYDPSSWGECPGQLKVSPDGTKLAITTSHGQRVEIYDFDNITGTLSNYRYYDSVNRNPWGVEFSPNSNQLYVGNNLVKSEQLQQFIIHPNGLELTYTANTTDTLWGFASLQLGPDDKIYVCVPGYSHLDVVNNPDGLGASCNFFHPGLALITGQGGGTGLPNNFHLSCVAPDTLAVPNQIQCGTSIISINTNYNNLITSYQCSSLLNLPGNEGIFIFGTPYPEKITASLINAPTTAMIFIIPYNFGSSWWIFPQPVTPLASGSQGSPAVSVLPAQAYYIVVDNSLPGNYTYGVSINCEAIQPTEGCDNPIKTLNTGQGTGINDPIWSLISSPLGTGPALKVQNPLSLPMDNSTWISPPWTTPSTTAGLYVYQCDFNFIAGCPCSLNTAPSINLFLLAENADVYINNTFLGNASSQFNPTHIMTIPGQYINCPGNNTLKILLVNPADAYPIIDVKAWICCMDEFAPIECGQTVQGVTTYNLIDTYDWPPPSLLYSGNEAIYQLVLDDKYVVKIRSCDGGIGLDLNTNYFIVTNLPNTPLRKISPSEIKARGNYLGILSGAILPAGTYYIIVDNPIQFYPGIPLSYPYCFTVSCYPYDPWPGQPYCDPELVIQATLNTGTINSKTDSLDPFWKVWPTEQDSATSAVICPWEGVPFWGEPQVGTNWISYMKNPPLSAENFGFVNEFLVPDSCESPWLKLAIMGGMADIELNGQIIGTSYSQTYPTIIDNSYDLRRGVKNTLKVLLYNRPSTTPGINIRGELCSTGGPIGISKIIDEKPFNIYPNPVNDKLIIESKTGVELLILYNSVGQKVFEKSNVQNKSVIDVETLPPGIYIVLLQTNQATFTEKVSIWR